VDKISVNGLAKTFRGQKVLKNITFQIPLGNVVTLLGGSGAGKSTLLRCLCQLENPDQGAIELHGKRIGIVLQQFHLWTHMTIIENLITAPIHVLKIPKQVAIEEAIKLLTQLNIADKMHHYPNQLSGGEQQRAAIARALMMKPDIMLFDEPTSALDPLRTQSVAEIIQALAKKGMTIIAATHDLGFAKMVASNAMFLENGEILETAEIKNKEIYPITEAFTKFLNSEDNT